MHSNDHVPPVQDQFECVGGLVPGALDHVIVMKEGVVDARLAIPAGHRHGSAGAVQVNGRLNRHLIQNA